MAALRLRLVEFEKDCEELLRVRRQEAAARHKLKALEWDHEVELPNAAVLGPVPWNTQSHCKNG